MIGFEPVPATMTIEAYAAETLQVLATPNLGFVPDGPPVPAGRFPKGMVISGRFNGNPSAPPKAMRQFLFLRNGYGGNLLFTSTPERMASDTALFARILDGLAPLPPADDHPFIRTLFAQPFSGKPLEPAGWAALKTRITNGTAVHRSYKSLYRMLARGDPARPEALEAVHVEKMIFNSPGNYEITESRTQPIPGKKTYRVVDKDVYMRSPGWKKMIEPEKDEVQIEYFWKLVELYRSEYKRHTPFAYLKLLEACPGAEVADGLGEDRFIGLHWTVPGHADPILGSNALDASGQVSDIRMIVAKADFTLRGISIRVWPATAPGKPSSAYERFFTSYGTAFNLDRP